MKKYQCANSRCLVCDRRGVDLHHLKTRKSGGSDAFHNLMPLCRQHHTEVHQIGLFKFSHKGLLKVSQPFNNVWRYNLVYSWLITKGWLLDELAKKWTHPVEHGQACVVCFNEECTCKVVNRD